MVDRFPHMNDTDFPGLPDGSNFLNNRFNYKKYDKAQMRIGICSVPWDVGLIHVGNAQIGGLGNVVYFESKEARDAYFDGIGGYVFDTEYREYHSDGSIQIPLPYEKAVLYNYVWVEYTRLPTEYSEGGKDRFFFFIRECESLSSNDTKVTILRDTWQTFVYDIDISYMMLEQGHAPMSIVDADTYLANPIDNNSWLLAEDVNFGNSYKRKYHNSIVLNTDDMKAVIVTTANLLGDWNDKTPDGHVVVDGNPSYYAYALNPEQLAAFLSAVDAQCPQFSQTVQGVFFVSARLVSLLNAVTFCGYELTRLEQKTSDINLADLTKAAFGYGEDYANLAKLYTYPYAFLEIADGSGDVTQIKIEETSGNLSLIVTTSLAYPWIAIDGRLTGVGEGSASIEFYNVDEHTFDFQGSWYDHLHRWEVPIFGITQSAAIVDAYSHKFEREQRERELYTALGNATRSANTSYDNAVNSARTGFTNAVASADTAKLNADAADNTAYSNAVASADTSKTNADAADNAAYSNAVASADTGKTNADAADNAAYANAVASADNAKNVAYTSADTARDIAKDSAATVKTNANNMALMRRNTGDRLANTTWQNSYRLADVEKANSDRAANTTNVNAHNDAQTINANVKETASRTMSNEKNSNRLVRDNFANQRQLSWDYWRAYFQDDYVFADRTARGYVGAQAYINEVKLEDDCEIDKSLMLKLAYEENELMASTTTINGIGSAVNSTVGGAVSGGMVGGAQGIVGGAVSGLIGGSITLATSQAAIPVIQASAIDMVELNQWAADRKTQNAVNYTKNQSYATSRHEWKKQTLEDNWLTKIADRSLSIGNSIAEKTLETAEKVADRAKSTADANADNAKNTSLKNSEESNKAVKQNADDSRNTAITNNREEYEATVNASAATKNTADSNANARNSTDKEIADRNRNTAVANAQRSRDTGLQANSRTRNTAVANADRSRNTGLQSNSRTRNTAVANAERSRDTGLQSNSRTRNTAAANATRTRDASIENALRSKNTDLANAQDSYDTGIAGIQAEVDQAALAAPVKYGEFANGETSATRPQGLFCNIVTQSKDAIEQTGDYWLRFGYKVNRSWRFTGFNLMPHFTYWKASDMWIAGNNVPDAYLDEIRFYLLGGVCVWRNPDDIGRISIYENMR